MRFFAIALGDSLAPMPFSTLQGAGDFGSPAGARGGLFARFVGDVVPYIRALKPNEDWFTTQPLDSLAAFNIACN